MRKRVAALGVLLLLSNFLVADGVQAQALAAPPPLTGECRSIMQQGPRFLEQCEDRLNAWALTLEFKRKVENDQHGRFYFICLIPPMCENEPDIAGRFVSVAEWQNGAKDLHYPLRPLPPMQTPACPLFDIAIAGVAGRAACFGESGIKGGVVVAVAADDRVAFLLAFSRQDMAVNALKEKVVELLPRFKIERATGDAALMKWFK